MLFKNLRQGSRFKVVSTGKEYTKVGNAYSIDDYGKEHILSLKEVVEPMNGHAPSPFLPYHLEFINFGKGVFIT